MPGQTGLSFLKAEQYSLNPERRIALLVGVDEAPLSGKSPLKHAVADARAMATALRDQHCGFQLLTEPLLNEQATSTQVKRAILNLKRSRNDNDFLLFYFSGHGLVWESEGGSENVYLVTHDFSREEANDDPHLHISLKWLREMLYEQTGAGEVVIILDCCYAGNMSGTAPDPYLEDLKERLFRYFDTSSATSGARMNGLRQTLAATGYNMTALESDDGHGRMTGLILLALEGKVEQAREDDGRITIYTLYSHLQNEMPVDHPPGFSGGSAGRSGLLAYYPELRHKQTVGQQLTAGLTVLSTDYAARIQNFFTEYLGTPERPVPFGGRNEDMVLLDSWLDNLQKPPYLLLAAPAGRGKSALLVRWIQPLLKRNDLAVVFLPVSIRFRTNLASVTFAALTARLAFLHGEKVTATSDTPLEVWRGLVTDYLTRPLPNGQRLLLVVDGVDEAADWEVGPDIFPLAPPEGLRVIVSARYLAGDTNAKPWLGRLGWHRPELASFLDLNPLSPQGVADVLQRMGFPLNHLGARVDIVNELYRLSTGDPLLVRLYVDDLWERGETAARLQPEDLREIRPGLEGYFERWWEDQRRLWGIQWPLREPAVQLLLSLLAGALGPLSQEDVLRLAPPDIGLSSWTLEGHLNHLKRFIVGDGRRQGYVLSHPRLSTYFYEERLTAPDRRIIESRFLDWGRETLIALNKGSLSSEHVSPYIVQYYGTHLERADCGPQDFLPLVSLGWKLAWEKVEGAYAGFINDAGKVWRVLECHNAAVFEGGRLPAPYIGDEVRCALCQASFNSMAKNIPPALLLRVVEQGIWNPAQGLAYARCMPDLEERAQTLIKLVPFLPEFLRDGVIQEAIEAGRAVASSEARVRTLGTLLPHLPGTLTDQILNEALLIAEAIVDQEPRARALTELLPHLPENVKVEVMSKMLKILRTDTGNDLNMYLMMLAPHLPDSLLQEMLETIWTIDDEDDEALVLIALAPRLSPALLQFTLKLALAENAEETVILLSPKLIPYLPETSREKVRQKALELVRRTTDGSLSLGVSALLPHLPEASKEEVIRDALEIVRIADDEETQIFVLLALVPHLSQTRLGDAIEIARIMESETTRALLLAALAPLLPDASREQGLQEAFQAAQRIKEKDLWIQVLTALAPHLSEKQLREALEDAQTIRDRAHQLQTQLALVPHLPEELLKKVLDEARAIREKELRVRSLANLLPHVSKTQQDEVVQEILGTSRAIEEKEMRFWFLSSLLPSLPETCREEVVQEVLAAVQTIKQKEAKVEILVMVFPYLPEILQEKVWREIWADATVLNEKATRPSSTMEITQIRIHVLTALLPYLPEALKQETLLEVLAEMRMLPMEHTRALSLVKLLPYLSDPLKSEVLQEEVKRIRTIEERKLRQVLEILEPHLPEQLIQKVLEEVRVSKNETEQAEAALLLVSHLSTKQKREAFNLALRLEQQISREWAIKVAEEQTKALITLLPQLPGSFKERVAMEALQAARGIEEEETRIEVLVDLFPHLSEQQRAQVTQEILQIMRAMKMQVDLVETLADLFPYLSEQQRDELVQEVLLAIQTYYMPMLAIGLVAAIPYLSRQQREEIVQEALLGAEKIENMSERARTLIRLVPYVAEPQQGAIIQETLLTAKEIQERRELISIILPSLPSLPSQQQNEIIQQALQIMSEAQQGFRIMSETLAGSKDVSVSDQITDQFFVTYSRFFVQLLPYLSEQQQREVVLQLLQVAQASGMPTHSVQFLLTLLPSLSETLQKEIALGVLRGSGSSEHAREKRTEILVKLIPYVPDQQQELALEVLSLLEAQLNMYREAAYPESEGDQAPALTKDMEALSQLSLYREEMYPERAGAWSLAYIKDIVVLLPYLSAEQRKETVQKVLRFARIRKLQTSLIPLLPDLLPYLPESQRAEVVQQTLQATREINHREVHTATVSELIPYLPQQQQDEVIQQILLDVRNLRPSPYRFQPWSRQSRSFVWIPLLVALLPTLSREQRKETTQKVISALPDLPESQQVEIRGQILQALREMDDKGKHDETLRTDLSSLLQRLNERFQEYLRLSRSSTNKLARAWRLAQLAPYLSDPQQQEIIEQFLQLAHESHISPLSGERMDTYFPFGELLIGLLPHLSTPQQQELAQKILSIVQAKEAQESLVESLPETLPSFSGQQEEILRAQQIRRRKDGELQRIRLMAKLVPYLPQQQQREVVQEVIVATRTRENMVQRAETLLTFIPSLPQQQQREVIQEVVAAAESIESEAQRAEILAMIIPHLPQQQQREMVLEVLQMVQTLRKQSHKAGIFGKAGVCAGVLAMLAPHLSGALLQQALEDTRKLGRAHTSAAALTEFVPYLPEPQKQTVVQEILDLAWEKEEQEPRGYPPSALRLRPRVPAFKLPVPISIASRLLPYLSDQQRAEVIQIPLKLDFIIQNEENLKFVVKSIPYLPKSQQDEMIQKLFSMLQAIQIKKEEEKDAEIEALSILFPFLADPLLEEVIKEELTTPRESSKMPVLIELLPYLSSVQKEQMVREALKVAKALERIEDKTRIFTELVPHLTRLPAAALYTFWCEILHMLAHSTRKDLLANLTPLIPIILLQGGPEGIVATSRAILEVGNWWP